MYDGPNSWTDKYCHTTYSCSARPSALVIVYTADKTVAAQFPHGNASNNRNYVCTQPHVLHDIRNSGSKSCKNIYQSMITTAATIVTAAPRDLEQIWNTKIIRNNAWLSRNALYNLHEFAYEYSNFIHRILTFPDLSVYNPEMMNNLTDDDALKYNKLSYHKQVALYHITT